MAPKRDGLLEYEGVNFFRQRLVLSVLSGKPLVIKNIRSNSNKPGLQEFEVNLIRLLDKLTNGTVIEVNETGTELYFEPGLLIGGAISHECCKMRSIGYFLETLIPLGPFCKKNLDIRLIGVTNSLEDPSVDAIKLSALPVLRRFLIVDDGLELNVVRRGMPPEGGGEVKFRCPIRKEMRPILCLESGKVKRVRGLAYAVRVSPIIANRIVESAKGVLLQFLPDIYIHTDQLKGASSGRCPGFGVVLAAETTDGVFYFGEAMTPPLGSGAAPAVPEELGELAAKRLLQEIYRGGCVDSTFQTLPALFMALGKSNVSKFETGPLTPYTVEFLRHLRDFFGVTFKLDSVVKEDEDSDLKLGSSKVLMTCLGIGFTNLSKRHN